jgi:acyl carrier protein
VSADVDALVARAARWLADELGVPPDAVAQGQALVTDGLVDSAGLAQLATMLETAGAPRIPDRDLRAEHFDSLARLRAYLAARLGG